MPSIESADVDGGQTCDGHGRDADKEGIDKLDVILTIACVEDGCGEERSEGEDENVDSEEVEVSAAPSAKGEELVADGRSGCTGRYAFEHVDEMFWAATIESHCKVKRGVCDLSFDGERETALPKETACKVIEHWTWCISSWRDDEYGCESRSSRTEEVLKR